MRWLPGLTLNCVVYSSHPTGDKRRKGAYEVRSFLDNGTPCLPEAAEHYRVLAPQRVYLCIRRDIGKFGHIIEAIRAAEHHHQAALREHERLERSLRREGWQEE